MAPGMPDRLYQQNHCGMYRSDDGGRHWESIEAGLPSTFGFPAAAHPRDPDTLYLLPLNGDSAGRYVPDGKAAVWRTRDGGESWQALREGLPQENAFFGVLRQAMATDRLEPAGRLFRHQHRRAVRQRRRGRQLDLHRRSTCRRSPRSRRWSSRREPMRTAHAGHAARDRAPVMVRLPALLVDLFPGAVRRVELAAATVGEMIDALDAAGRACATGSAIPRRRSAGTSTSSSTASGRSWRRRSRRARRCSC